MDLVAVARSLTKWGAAVILIHHDTKDGQQGLPRGHSLLNGALDMSLHLKRGDKGIIRGTLTKNRNGSCDVDIAFTIAVKVIGRDEDGEEITAGVCNPLASNGLQNRQPLTRNEKSALAALRMVADFSGVASRKSWRDLCLTEPEYFPDTDTPRAKRTAFLRAEGALISKGYVNSSGNNLQVVEFSSVEVSDFEDESDE